MQLLYTGAPVRLTNTLMKSKSLSVVWGIVSCLHQQRPMHCMDTDCATANWYHDFEHCRRGEQTACVDLTDPIHQLLCTSGSSQWWRCWTIQYYTTQCGDTAGWWVYSVYQCCSSVVTVCVPVQFLVQCLVCQPLLEWEPSYGAQWSHRELWIWSRFHHQYWSIELHQHNDYCNQCQSICIHHHGTSKIRKYIHYKFNYIFVS